VLSKRRRVKLAFSKHRIGGIAFRICGYKSKNSCDHGFRVKRISGLPGGQFSASFFDQFLQHTTSLCAADSSEPFLYFYPSDCLLIHRSFHDNSNDFVKHHRDSAASDSNTQHGQHARRNRHRHGQTTRTTSTHTDTSCLICQCS
jgi:hypothetical protein